jgi:hypothetical protein
VCCTGFAFVTPLPVGPEPSAAARRLPPGHQPLGVLRPASLSDRCVGRNPGGLITKIHARVDAKGRPVCLLIALVSGVHDHHRVRQDHHRPPPLPGPPPGARGAGDGAARGGPPPPPPRPSVPPECARGGCGAACAGQTRTGSQRSLLRRLLGGDLLMRCRDGVNDRRRRCGRHD